MRDEHPTIDSLLTSFFENSIKRAKKIDKFYEDLWMEMFRLHKTGGKRLRPKLVMLAYNAFAGKQQESIVPIAAAQELLHFSMLIHDDIIDRDTKRYGVLNITGSYKNRYDKYVADQSSQLHYANSAAILAGDLMIASAYKLINDSSVDASKKINAHSILFDSMFDVAGGELIDTEAAFRPVGSIDPLKIAHYKTASYSFVGPLVTGAMLADADKASLEHLREFAVNIGIAYQLTDDLLGVFGNEETTGKSTSTDLREGKETLLIQLLRQRLSKSEQIAFEKQFGNPEITDSQTDDIRNLIISSGAKSGCEDMVDSYIDKALAELSLIGLSQQYESEFTELVRKATKRNY